MTNTIKTGDLSEAERRRHQAAVDKATAQQFITGRSTLAEFIQVNPNIIKLSIEVLRSNDEL